MSIASNLVFIRDIYVTLLYCRGYEIQDRLKLITNKKKKKRILGVTVVYDFLATSHRLRAGPNAKTKDDRTDKLICKSFRIKVGCYI